MEQLSLRAERIIAGARLVLSITAIGLVLVYPSDSGFEANPAYSVVALYLLYAIAVLWIVDRNLMSVKRVGFLTQALDSLWFPVILIYTQGPHSPFFLYYVFSLITASFRWGFKETLYVNTANVGMYVIVHFATVGTDLGFYRFWVRPTYLYVLACLIGYLGEHQRRSQRQLISLNTLSSSIKVRERFSPMLEDVMEHARQMFHVEQCVLVYYDEESAQFFLKRVVEGKEGRSNPAVQLTDNEARSLLEPRQNLGYLMNPHRRAARVFGLTDVFCYDFDTQKPVAVPLPNRQLNSLFDMRSLLSVPILFTEQFKGRVFLVNKDDDNFSHADLHYLKLMVSQVGPLLENYRLLKRMRTISVLEEKGRIARDLHDGLVQSLASLDLRIQVCLKLFAQSPREAEAELKELQQIVRAEYGQLRAYMQRLRAPAFVGEDLLKAIEDLSRAYEKESGVVVKVVVEPTRLNLPKKVGREIYQMIQEGLTNIKKHAGAHHVLIRLTCEQTTANLVIADDGQGFPRKSGEGVRPEHEEPWSIYERTRALNGSLAVDSSPGKGSTLFIRIPVQQSDQ